MIISWFKKNCHKQPEWWNTSTLSYFNSSFNPVNELFGLSEIINWLGYIKLNLFTLNGTDFSEAEKDCYLLLLTKDIYFNCYLKSIKIIANSGDFDMVYRLKVQFLVIEQEDETVRTMGRDKYRSALKRTPSQLCSLEGEKIYFICKVFN